MMSIFILIIIISLTLSISSRLIISVKDRKDKVNMRESMYAICSELKYNVSFAEIEEKLSGGSKKFRYSNTLLKDLLDRDILSLENGLDESESFEILILEKVQDLIKLKITIKYNGEIISQEIIKAEWMDEI